jgi:hypothetical protein
MSALASATDWLATRGTLIALAALCFCTLAQCGGR